MLHARARGRVSTPSPRALPGAAPCHFSSRRPPAGRQPPRPGGRRRQERGAHRQNACLLFPLRCAAQPVERGTRCKRRLACDTQHIDCTPWVRATGYELGVTSTTAPGAEADDAQKRRGATLTPAKGAAMRRQQFTPPARQRVRPKPGRKRSGPSEAAGAIRRPP